MAKDKEQSTLDGTYADGNLVQIPLVNLEPGPNYRSQLRDMEALVASVYEFGVLAPLWVEPHPTRASKYTIFSGRRRYEAARQVALRRAKESHSDEALAVQVGRYTVPCRIFRNLSRHRQAVYALVENLVRTDPSTQDTAREIARAKKLLEEQEGRKVSVDEMMTHFEGAGGHGGKVFHRRHVYRLLRIAEMDPRVLDEARRQEVDTADLEALGRLPDPEMQLALVESIQREKLTRQEVRIIVNQVLASGSDTVSLPPLIERTRRGNATPPEHRDVTVAEEVRAVQMASCRPMGDAVQDPAPSAIGERSLEGSASLPVSAVSSETLRPLGKEKVLAPGEGLAVTPSAVSGEQFGQNAPLGGEAPVVTVQDTRDAVWCDPGPMVDWLQEVEARFGLEEVRSIEKALGEEVAYTPQDIAIMRAMHRYKGILSEHLPGYLGRVKETMAESPWFGGVVTSSLGLPGLLARREEYKRLTPIPGRLVEILLSDLCGAAAPYDQNLAYYSECVSQYRKEEFGRPIEAKK